MKIDKGLIIAGVVGLFLLTRKPAMARDTTIPSGEWIPGSSGGGLLDSAGNPIPPGYYQNEYGAIVRPVFG